MSHKPMTVAMLRKKLEKIPGEYRVFLSSDEEGNNFGQATDSGICAVNDEGDVWSISDASAKDERVYVLFP